MSQMNCWEFKKCGRQPGGIHVSKLGVCPAAVCSKAEGINCGHNGGRSCWAITGTLCGGVIQGTFASKITNCFNCEFYLKVQEEEGANFVKASEILKKIK